MASASASKFKAAGGGGFLNNVDGTITGYKISESGPTKSKKDPKKFFNFLNFELSVRVDGATEDVTTRLSGGFADDWEISDDGLTITPVKDKTPFTANNNWAKFISSLENPLDGEAGFDPDNFPEGDEDDYSLNWEPVINARATFAQVPDEARVGEFTVDKNDPTKKWPIRRLAVKSYLGQAEPAKKGKGVSAAPVKGKGKAKAEDAATGATEALLRYLAKAGDDGIEVSKLRMKVLTDSKLANQPEVREAYALWLTNNDNLADIEGVTLVGEGKKAKVTLASTEEDDN